MNILILQGSPRANGNTAWMAEEYRKAAEAAGRWGEGAMNHERLKPTRLCILFRGENEMVQRSARNQRPVILKTCYNTEFLRGSASPLVESETGV